MDRAIEGAVFGQQFAGDQGCLRLGVFDATFIGFGDATSPIGRLTGSMKNRLTRAVSGLSSTKHAEFRDAADGDARRCAGGAVHTRLLVTGRY